MKHLGLLLLLLCGFSVLGNAQTTAAKTGQDSLMITVFLKHQQDKSLDSLQKIQKQNKFLERFPPKNVRVVGWYVIMGIGQVVIVKLPASELRNLNLSLERGAWGAFETEFYPTYDFIPVWKDMLKAPK